jgi:RNA polymerase-interacting CarD/CdnL/TRCF family regulator
MSSTSSQEFEIGQVVIYGVHGKCLIKTIESRSMNGQNVSFYKLEIAKQSAMKKQDSFIFVPVSSAKQRGLRIPANEDTSQKILHILSDPEYFFEMSRNWQQTFQKLKLAIETEGAIGLAKVINFLHAMKKKQSNLSADIIKFEAQVFKQLVRELAESLEEPSLKIEEKIESIFKTKQIQDH